jgi:hypothetical protein
MSMFAALLCALSLVLPIDVAVIVARALSGY